MLRRNIAGFMVAGLLLGSAPLAHAYYEYYWTLIKTASPQSITVEAGEVFEIDYVVYVTANGIELVDGTSDIDECGTLYDLYDSIYVELGSTCSSVGETTDFSYTRQLVLNASETIENTAYFVGQETGNVWTSTTAVVNVTVNEASVPEPATLGLLGLGLAGLAASRRRKQ